MAFYDGKGNQIPGASGSVAVPVYSEPDRIVVKNATLTGSKVSAYDGCNICEYFFPAGSRFFLGETGGTGSVFWLYANRVDFAVGDSTPSGGISTQYVANSFTIACASFYPNHITCVSGEYVFNAISDLYLYVPDTVMIVRNPTDEFVDMYKTQGANFATANSGFLLWDDGYVDTYKGQLTKDLLSVEHAEVADEKNFRAVNRTPDDGELYINFIGDSIIQANSVGVAHAYRTIVPGHFNAPNGYTAQNGACIASGYGATWGDGGLAGYAGLSAKLDEASDYRSGQYDIVVFAMGTNDWGNDVPLGTIDDVGDTTFYGALKMTYDKLMARFPNASFIVLIPFKRENWNTKNEAGHYLLEYCRAIYEVLNLRKYRHFYILDLFDKWFLNWDNEAMRSHYFVDYVHPNKTAHICIAKALEDKISEVIAIEGIKKVVPTE